MVLVKLKVIRGEGKEGWTEERKKMPFKLKKCCFVHGLYQGQWII